MLATVRDALERHRFVAATESELQGAIAEALVRAGFDVQREVRLSGRDRIDLLVSKDGSRVGVEVKVAGPPADIIRQLDRYASHGTRISALLLVTTCVQHVRPIERVAALRGCPVQCLHVGGLR